MNNPFKTILAESSTASVRHPRGKGTRPRPRFCFRVENDWTIGRVSEPSLAHIQDFVGTRFDADLVPMAKLAERPLTRIEVDFVWLAAAVYFADRLSPRFPYGDHGPSYWRRNIHVTLAMGAPEVWRKVEPELRFALSFLTEDDWSFEFLGDRSMWSDVESQSHFAEFVGTGSQWTALFSGGLDSFAGALHWLTNQKGRGLLVSGQTHSRITVAQREQIASLQALFGGALEHVGISYRFKEKTALTGFESSQRTRAFVHVSLGALASILSGGQELHLFENGFGALNLPCDAEQSGSQNSRGTHPVFLQRMAAYVRAVFGQPFTITNPFLFTTKAEMLAAPALAEYSRLFAQTFSCDRYPNYHHRAHQCGFCPSCLVRRQSLLAAGLADESVNYTVDVFQPGAIKRERQVLPWAKLTLQASRLNEVLSGPEPWMALTTTWPDLLRTERELGQEDFRERTMRLLRRHVREWGLVLSRAGNSESLAPAA